MPSIRRSGGKKNAGARLVLIEWLDSARPVAAWQHLSDYMPMLPVRCVSVGFLLHDGKKVKALAPNMGDVHDADNIQASGIIHIPTRSIVRIRKLEEV